MSSEIRRGSSRKEPGFVVVTVALSLLAMMGFAALAIDMGFFRYVKRSMQNASDAAAVGAAMAYAHDEDGQTLGRGDAARNGYTHGTEGVNVAVNRPPGSGYFSGNNAYVEVVISQSQSTLFMNALGVGSARTSGPVPWHTSRRAAAADASTSWILPRTTP